MLRELSVTEQRYWAVLEVGAGVPVTEVAERYGVSRQSVHSWLVRGSTLTPAAAPALTGTCPGTLAAFVSGKDQVAMPIIVQCADDNCYTAQISPPHGTGSTWSTERPVTGRELTALLLAQGCHQTDIGDALYAADAEWLSHLNG
jgi:hypothetical protein